jgi:hypothetical protein
MLTVAPAATENGASLRVVGSSRHGAWLPWMTTLPLWVLEPLLATRTSISLQPP